MIYVIKCFNIKEVLNKKIYITRAVLLLAPPDFTPIEQQKSSENWSTFGACRFFK